MSLPAVLQAVRPQVQPAGGVTARGSGAAAPARAWSQAASVSQRPQTASTSGAAAGVRPMAGRQAAAPAGSVPLEDGRLAVDKRRIWRSGTAAPAAGPAAEETPAPTADQAQQAKVEPRGGIVARGHQSQLRSPAAAQEVSPPARGMVSYGLGGAAAGQVVSDDRHRRPVSTLGLHPMEEARKSKVTPGAFTVIPCSQRPLSTGAQRQAPLRVLPAGAQPSSVLAAPSATRVASDVPAQSATLQHRHADTWNGEGMPSPCAQHAHCELQHARSVRASLQSTEASAEQQQHPPWRLHRSDAATRLPVREPHPLVSGQAPPQPPDEAGTIGTRPAGISGQSQAEGVVRGTQSELQAWHPLLNGAALRRIAPAAASADSAYSMQLAGQSGGFDMDVVRMPSGELYPEPDVPPGGLLPKGMILGIGDVMWDFDQVALAPKDQYSVPRAST
jgi:hypothetical protein